MQYLRELSLRLREAASYDEAGTICSEAGVDYVDLRFADLPGRWHHVTLPAARVGAKLFEDGVGFDGSSVPGYLTVEKGDMVLLADPATAIVEESGPYLVVSYLASAAEADTRELFPLDPRVLAKKAEEILAASGHADTALLGPELEFYLFTTVDYGSSCGSAFYSLGSDEAGWTDADEPTTGHRILPGRGYHAMPPCDRTFQVRNEIVARMAAAGIPVKYHHHENGAPGQVEIELLSRPLVEAADDCMIGKYIAKMTAIEWGLSATFMPKPLLGESGSGLHFHMRLEKAGRPVFHDERGYAGLSEAALHFIGGILEHGAALTAVTNPSTNSYRRLRPGFEAPTNRVFSAANRSAAIRIPKYTTEPSAKTVEYRPSDATCNPYLAAAALIAAGLDGMERGIDPRERGFGPLEKNIHRLSDKERRGIPALPLTLHEALEALADDGGFLASSGIFPETFVPVWTGLKWEEVDAIRSAPHPGEFDLSFDC
ncbi:MAG: type I glutamate--ammonia ligase [Candidatus Eisenbacteria bacterium]|nr:type I glutamate--ammonia ligase [Candidatus Eisenbacteria bacterium]